MSQILYPPARPQTIGEVLQTGGQIFRLSLAVTCLTASLSRFAAIWPICAI